MIFFWTLWIQSIFGKHLPHYSLWECKILTEIIWVLINNNLNIKVMDFIGVIIFAAIAQFLLMTAWRPDIDDLTNSEYFRWPESKFFSSKIFNKGYNIVILVGKIAQRIWNEIVKSKLMDWKLHKTKHWIKTSTGNQNNIRYTAWEVFVFGVILVRILLHSDWIRRDNVYPVRMHENADQNNSKDGHFLRSDNIVSMSIILNQPINRIIFWH